MDYYFRFHFPKDNTTFTEAHCLSDADCHGHGACIIPGSHPDVRWCRCLQDALYDTLTRCEKSYFEQYRIAPFVYFGLILLHFIGFMAVILVELYRETRIKSRLTWFERLRQPMLIISISIISSSLCSVISAMTFIFQHWLVATFFEVLALLLFSLGFVESLRFTWHLLAAGKRMSAPPKKRRCINRWIAHTGGLLLLVATGFHLTRVILITTSDSNDIIQQVDSARNRVIAGVTMAGNICFVLGVLIPICATAPIFLRSIKWLREESTGVKKQNNATLYTLWKCVLCILVTMIFIILSIILLAAVSYIIDLRLVSSYTFYRWMAAALHIGTMWPFVIFIRIARQYKHRRYYQWKRERSDGKNTQHQSMHRQTTVSHLPETYRQKQQLPRMLTMSSPPATPMASRATLKLDEQMKHAVTIIDSSESSRARRTTLNASSSSSSSSPSSSSTSTSSPTTTMSHDMMITNQQRRRRRTKVLKRTRSVSLPVTIHDSGVIAAAENGYEESPISAGSSEGSGGDDDDVDIYVHVDHLSLSRESHTTSLGSDAVIEITAHHQQMLE